MNTDSNNPVPPDKEARLTALLLGELAPDEAADVMSQLQANPELALLYERLRQTLALVADAVTAPTQSMKGRPDLDPKPGLRFSDQRRHVLLNAFKTVAPVELEEQPQEKPRHGAMFWLRVAAAVALLGVVAGMIIPALSKAKAKAQLVRLAASTGVSDGLPAPKPLGVDALDDKAEKLGELSLESRSKVKRGEVELKEVLQKSIRDGQAREVSVALGFNKGAPGSTEERPNGIYLPTSPPTESPAEAAGVPLAGVEAFGDRNTPVVRSETLSRGLSNVQDLSVTTERLAATVTSRYGLMPSGTVSEQKERELLRESDTSAPAANPPPPATPFRLGAAAARPMVEFRKEEFPAPSLQTADPLARVEGESAGQQVDNKPVPARTGGEDRDRVDASLADKASAGAPVQNRFFGGNAGGRKELADELAAASAPTKAKQPVNSETGKSFGQALESRTRTLASTDKNAATQSAGRIAVLPTASLGLTRAPVAQAPAEKKADQKVALAKRAALAQTLAESKDKEAKETPPVSEAQPAPEPQSEQVTLENAVSTFSLNVSDVSFKLAAAGLASGTLPSPGAVRSEEFINAFDYRDPQPSAGSPIGFAWDRTRYAFGHNQDLLRFSIKTAALGREAGRPYNLVILLDNSGSMERADRVGIIHEILSVLSTQLRPQDRVSVVAFARTARLWVDGLPGSQVGELVKKVGDLAPEGGTNLEEALRLGYETALRHFMAKGVNRVILLTDGAANLGEVNPEALQTQVEAHRKRGVALDCFGIGWEGYNDHLLEVLSRHGDGRYGFVNSAEEASTGFVNQLAGALHVAAADVKVQVEFNPLRVPTWRQIGYAKHQLKKEQFRDNTVDAAELAAAEAGNALYVAQINPRGEGAIGVVRARFREPSTGIYRELEWPVPYTGGAGAIEQANPAMRLAGVSALFAEWLASSPYASEVTLDKLQQWLRNVPEAFSPDPRPRQLETMLRQARSISGK